VYQNPQALSPPLVPLSPAGIHGVGGSDSGQMGRVEMTQRTARAGHVKQTSAQRTISPSRHGSFAQQAHNGRAEKLHGAQPTGSTASQRKQRFDTFLSIWPTRVRETPPLSGASSTLAVKRTPRGAQAAASGIMTLRSWT
jgi:hypothetical protein